MWNLFIVPVSFFFFSAHCVVGRKSWFSSTINNSILKKPPARHPSFQSSSSPDVGDHCPSRRQLQAEAWALPHHCSLLGFQEWGSVRGSVFTGSQPGWEGGGVSGNARGQRGYDKYLLWHTGRAGRRENKRKKKKNKWKRWKDWITFEPGSSHFSFCSLRCWSIHPSFSSPPSSSLSLLLLASSWQGNNNCLLWK